MRDADEANTSTADRTVRLALAQIRIVGGRVGDNVERATAAVERAAAGGADLVALPELFTVGFFAFDSYAREAEGLDGPTLSRLSDLAAEHDIGIQAGSIVEDLAASEAAGYDVPAAEGFANAAVFLDRRGDVRGVYRKRHLFGYGSTGTGIMTPGETLPTVEFEGFTVGMTTSYDLRFPELYRELTDEGATLLLVPSAWPYPQVEHWTTLPRARAIENLSYVATINGSGTIGDDSLLGRSTVYDPWGTTLASSDEDPTLVTADVSTDRVAALRQVFPALRDRRT